MLRLLLDEHLSPTIAAQVRAHNPAITIYSLQEWEQGRYLKGADTTILAAAHEQRLTLITYDQRTIRPLIATWAERGRDHSGVVFISERVIPSNDFGRLVRVVLRLWTSEREHDWLNRVIYLNALLS